MMLPWHTWLAFLIAMVVLLVLAACQVPLR